MNEDELIARYVEPNPRKPQVEEARLVVDYAVPVWALVGYWEAAGGDVDRVAADYDVPREAVETALAYYQRHRCAIDARIAANAA